jgi:hypothetical protein
VLEWLQQGLLDDFFLSPLKTKPFIASIIKTMDSLLQQWDDAVSKQEPWTVTPELFAAKILELQPTLHPLPQSANEEVDLTGEGKGIGKGIGMSDVAYDSLNDFR